MKPLLLLFAIFGLFQLGFVAGDFKAHNIEDMNRALNVCFEELESPQCIQEQFSICKLPPHESTACLAKCLLEKLDLFDDKKGFLTDNIVTQLTHINEAFLEPTKLALEKCVKAGSGTDACVWALQGFKCFMMQPI